MRVFYCPLLRVFFCLLSKPLAAAFLLVFLFLPPSGGFFIWGPVTFSVPRRDCSNSLKPIAKWFMFSSTVQAILIVIFAIGVFTGGYVVSSWRSAAQVQRLSSENAMLSEAKKKCFLDIQSVQNSMKALTQTAAEREKNAAKAIEGASSAAAGHTNRAKRIRTLPPIASERQYEAITREQAEYVQSRRNDH